MAGAESDRQRCALSATTTCWRCCARRFGPVSASSTPPKPTRTRPSLGRLLPEADPPADLLIATTFGHGKGFSADQFRASAERSLRELRLDRLPLMFVHDPRTAEDMRLIMGPGGALEGLRKLQSEGLLESHRRGDRDAAAAADRRRIRRVRRDPVPAAVHVAESDRENKRPAGGRAERRTSPRCRRRRLAERSWPPVPLRPLYTFHPALPEVIVGGAAHGATLRASWACRSPSPRWRSTTPSRC